jgi:hypothetical protein
MPNPYRLKGPDQFWRTGMATLPPGEIMPIRAKRFTLPPGTVLSTAGSCFAQNVALHLRANPAVRVLETEPVGPDQPRFSALYGNIYTVRQLVQLLDEAFGRRTPEAIVFRRSDGRYVDGLRPYVFVDGFTSPESVLAARAKHLPAVRQVFTDCSVFVFTLGLTEGWRAMQDGTVFPVAPGVVSDDVAPDEFEFHNFAYDEIAQDVDTFVTRLTTLNAGVRIILTVSPVPLTATYTDEHVLVATTHSKSILRAVCSAAEATHPNVFYFPAYEIITGPHSRGAYYAANLREVAPEGVAHVMRVFEANLLSPAANSSNFAPAEPATLEPSDEQLFSEEDNMVICDEEEIAKSAGFE